MAGNIIRAEARHNKFWKYSDNIYGFMQIINTPMIFTNLIPYNKEVIMYKIKEY